MRRIFLLSTDLFNRSMSNWRISTNCLLDSWDISGDSLDCIEYNSCSWCRCLKDVERVTIENVKNLAKLYSMKYSIKVGCINIMKFIL